MMTKEAYFAMLEVAGLYVRKENKSHCKRVDVGVIYHCGNTFTMSDCKYYRRDDRGFCKWFSPQVARSRYSSCHCEEAHEEADIQKTETETE